ncbi:C/D box methylation guide ribonucleoprotein complex aNOP56 subunit [Candidatus Bathyarchaeota archaeon]|nr:C/D box methylation guide ribonucleoprotein complex aNOP56 subunit [Candidatus Bathyarchaeota archaeon]
MREEGSARRIYIVESIIGLFGIDENNGIIERILYKGGLEEIAETIDRQRRGELTAEVTEAIRRLLEKGYTRFIFSNRALAEGARGKMVVDAEFLENPKACRYLRLNLERIALESGLVREASQLYEMNREISLILARRDVGRALSDREAIIIKAIQTLEGLDKALNTLSGKLREWYGLHFPELGRIIEDHETYSTILGELGDRTLMVEIPESINLDERIRVEISKASSTSIGAHMSEEDVEPVRRLASHLKGLYGFRRELEKYIMKTTLEVAPNLSELAGPILAARLIERAGGLKRLSMMPSGTIQLLGAEKAMFRALKTRSKPPKHGLIFQHPIVHNSPRKMRGSLARILASQLAVAARADALTGKYIGEELKRKLEAKLEGLKIHRK